MTESVVSTGEVGVVGVKDSVKVGGGIPVVWNRVDSVELSWSFTSPLLLVFLLALFGLHVNYQKYLLLHSPHLHKNKKKDSDPNPEIMDGMYYAKFV